jgi:DGQHR domain-containing protein
MDQPELFQNSKTKHDTLRVSVSIVTQGTHKFYTCTLFSDILAKCSFVSTRDEDPVNGFQRVLDKTRAQDIADYIDERLGTIPSSIILSAQTEANLRDVGQGKTIEFSVSPKSFLILDGQHRVFGFSLSKKKLRVPVVIYTNLTRVDESRLFIDINSKQRGVPSELLLDIKKLANYERAEEERLREIFDLFHTRDDSALLGHTSPAAKKQGHVSRATFNISAKNILSSFDDSETTLKIYETLNAYLMAFKSLLSGMQCEGQFTQTTVFRAIMAFFPSAAEKLTDRYGSVYTPEKFAEILRPGINSLKSDVFRRPGQSYIAVVDKLEQSLRARFKIS